MIFRLKAQMEPNESLTSREIIFIKFKRERECKLSLNNVTLSPPYSSGRGLLLTIPSRHFSILKIDLVHFSTLTFDSNKLRMCSIEIHSKTNQQ